MPTSELELQRAQEAGAAAAEAAPPDFPMPERDVRRKRPPALSLLLRWSTARQVVRVATLLAIDFVGLYAGLVTGLLVKGAIVGPWDPPADFQYAGGVIAFGYLVMVLLFMHSGLYNNRGERAGMSKIVSGLFQAVLVTLIFAVVTGAGPFGTYFIFYGTFVFAAAYIGLLRLGYERATGLLLRVRGRRRRALLVGSDTEQIEAVAQNMLNADQNLDVLGYLSQVSRADNGLRSLGPVEGLPHVLNHYPVDEVVVADPDFPEERAMDLVDECHLRGVRVRVAPSTMEILTHRTELVPGQAVPLFELKPPVFQGFDYLVKRSFDVVVSVGLLMLLSPLLLAVGLAIRLSSHGPMLYQSRRPGIGGEPFKCFKFRTMHRDADQRQAKLEAMNEADGALFKMQDDPRCTWIGKYLRRYSLDELPQLINVLRGEMSLVGPRPLTLRDFELLEEWHKKRYLVLPGITGLWQVSGRAELDFDDLVRLDFEYVERWSVSLDVTILLKTVPALISRRGAF